LQTLMLLSNVYSCYYLPVKKKPVTMNWLLKLNFYYEPDIPPTPTLGALKENPDPLASATFTLGVNVNVPSI
jgi:hypothetical protein